MQRLTLFLLWLFSVNVNLWGQVWYNHPELTWQSFETAHFVIHFHDGTERSAREAATVAEKVYGPITDIYDYTPPEKTHLIIKDVDDVSNGLAYYFDNKIEIWARPLDFDLRGSHRWIQSVITHEFVHIIQMGASMKFPRQIPGLYLQWIGYEDEKRKDVLYGYPNILVSYPIPNANIPPWFAEGAAQYMYNGADYDFWDTHRDMLLRDRVLHHNLLSFNAMNTFGKRGIGNESVYNQGFAFVRYLAKKYGVAVLKDLSKVMSAPASIDIDKALKKVTGTSGKQLFAQWQAALETHYAVASDNVLQNLVEGDILLSRGTANLHPVWHPTERKFAYLSNGEADYFSQTDLYIYDFSTKESKNIATGVYTAPVWNGVGSKVYYARRSKPDLTGARWLDLYEYNILNEDETRLTVGKRTHSPTMVGDNSHLAYVTVFDGTSNIELYNLNTGKITPVTDFDDGRHIYSLTYDVDDSTLIFDATIDNQGRELFQISLSTGEYTSFLPDVSWDVRDPEFQGGNTYLSMDATGIFNLYIISSDDYRGYLTNVPGGAFMPSVNADGEILYSLYQGGGYKIAVVKKPRILDEAVIGISQQHWAGRPEPKLELPNTSVQTEPYSDTMSKLFILPRVTIDYGTVKPGIYFYANEMIDGLSLFGGANTNSIWDTDFFLSFEFRKLFPTFYTEFFSLQRHVNQDFSWYDYSGKNDLRFNLIEGTIGARFPIRQNRYWLAFTHTRFRETVKTQVGAVSAGGFSFDYYIGNVASAKWLLDIRRPEYGSNMSPSNGFRIFTDIRYEWNDFIQDFGINEDYGTLATIFEANNTFRVRANFSKFFTLNRTRKISAAYEAAIGWLSKPDIDDFFHFFGGGQPGLRGYTYYDSTMQGPNLLINTVALRMPLMLEQNGALGHITLQNASVGIMYQVGDAFDGAWLRHRYKSSAGVEIRLSGFNFYVFPFALAYEVHRGLSPESEEARHYFSILFDF